ncbi:MAG: hypothetical protein H7327_07915 [Herminiimonas sp.]|nr:hypothetical protein [Herminiimonas sp.]
MERQALQSNTFHAVPIVLVHCKTAWNFCGNAPKKIILDMPEKPGLALWLRPFMPFHAPANRPVRAGLATSEARTLPADVADFAAPQCHASRSVGSEGRVSDVLTSAGVGRRQRIKDVERCGKS